MRSCQFSAPSYCTPCWKAHGLDTATTPGACQCTVVFESPFCVSAALMCSARRPCSSTAMCRAEYSESLCQPKRSSSLTSSPQCICTVKSAKCEPCSNRLRSWLLVASSPLSASRIHASLRRRKASAKARSCSGAAGLSKSMPLRGSTLTAGSLVGSVWKCASWEMCFGLLRSVVR